MRKRTFGHLDPVVRLALLRPHGGGGGTVTDVTGTAPVHVVNNTTTPVVSLAVPDNNILIGQVGGGSPAAHPVSGDATLSDAGVLTLDTVNPDVGTFGDGTHVAQVTLNAKGLVTAAVAVPITTGGAGTVTDVTGTAPVQVASGTTTPVVSLAMADNTILIGQVGGGSPAAHAVSGDATLSDAGVLTLDTVNPDVGTFGDGTHVAQVTVNAKGLVTAAVAVPITAGGTGTVTDVTGTAPIQVATGTTTPVVSLTLGNGNIFIGQAGSGNPGEFAVSGDATLNDSGVLTLATVNADVGTFGDGTHVAQVTVDGKGRITAVTDVAITTGAGTVTDVTATAPLTVTNPTTTPNLALTAPVADWQGNTATINVTGTAAVALTSNFTPAVSGLMDVIISGVLECAESSVTDHPFTIGISQGAGPSSGVYELATIPHVQNAATGGTPGSTPFSLVCSLDKITVVGPPVTFPVGTPAILNAVVVGDNSGQMTIPAKGLQMKVQERFA